MQRRGKLVRRSKVEAVSTRVNVFSRVVQVVFECGSSLEKLWRDFGHNTGQPCMFFVTSYTGEAFPSSAFLNFFQASGVDSAVFARASVSEVIWRDLQLLTTELFQCVFL